MKTFVTSTLLLLFSIITTWSQNRLEPVVQFGHPGLMVTEVVLSPDGEVLATTDGQYLKLWDLASGLEFKSFKSESSSPFLGGIRDLTFSADGNQISYLTNAEKIIRQVASGKVGSRETTIEDEIDMEAAEKNGFSEEDKKKMMAAERYRAQAFNQDHSLLAVLTSQKLEIKELPGNKVLKTIKLEDQGFVLFDRPVLQFSPDNQSILLDSIVYDINNGKPKFSIKMTEQRLMLTSAVFTPDGKSVVFCGGVVPPEKEEEEVALYDMQALIKKIYGVKAGTGKAILIVDANTGELQHTIETSSITDCMLNAKENKLITGHYNNEINVWDLASLQVVKTIQTQKNTVVDELSFGIQTMCLTKDGKSLIVGRSGGENTPKLSIWNFEGGQQVRTIGAAIPPINLEVTQSKKDSIILQEYEILSGFLPYLSEKKLKSFRILNLTNGKVPHAFPRYDSIVLSPNLSCYVRHTKDNTPLKVFRTQDNDELSTLESSTGDFKRLLFSPDGNWLAGQIKGGLYLWDTNSGELRHQIPKGSTDFFQIVFSASSNSLGATYRDKTLRFWSLDDGTVIWEDEASDLEKAASKSRDASDAVSEWDESATTSEWSETTTDPQEEKLDEAPKEEKKVAKLWGKVKRGAEKLADKAKDRFSSPRTPGVPGVPGAGQAESAIKAIETFSKFGGLLFNRFYDIELSPDQKYAALWRDDYASVRFMNLETGEEMRLINDWGLKLMQQMFMGPSGELSAEDRERMENDSTALKDENEIQTAAMLKFMKEGFNLKNLLAISPDWTRVAKVNKNMGKKKKNIGILFIDKSRKKEDYELEESTEYTEGITFSPNGKMIAASNSSDNEIRIWDAETGKVIKDIRGHSGKIAFSASSKTLISTGWDRQVKIYDLETNKELYTFIGIKGENEYIVMLPNGYYSTSRKDTRALAFAQGKKVYPFDQFDLAFNRPDLLLEEFRSSISSQSALDKNQNLIAAYYQAFQKRLERMNFQEDQLKKEIHVPEVKVSDLPLSSKSKKLRINVNASDTKYKLVSLHVTVNGVPALTGGSLSLKGQSTSNIDKQIEIELSNGENRIHVYAINELGASSLKYYGVVNYIGTSTKPNLHLVLLGVSSFADPSLNLQYPLKDLQDIEGLFKQQKGQYGEIYTHQLLDQNFTVTKLNSLAKTLSNTKVDDRVLIFVATHGMLGKDLNYYLATHNVDANTPATSGLSYEALNKILTSIPARQKVLFLDACHAGEVNNSTMVDLGESPETQGKLQFRALPATGWAKIDGQGALDLMKDLFVDLKNGTGATVVGSAGALEFALESDDWNNSVFTYALKHGLLKKVADLNSDGKIHLSELQQYLGFTVTRLTENLQQPIHRSENTLNDWVIW